MDKIYPNKPFYIELKYPYFFILLFYGDEYRDRFSYLTFHEWITRLPLFEQYISYQF